jgi:hypothetical protein
MARAAEDLERVRVEEALLANRLERNSRRRKRARPTQ